MAHLHNKAAQADYDARLAIRKELLYSAPVTEYKKAKKLVEDLKVGFEGGRDSDEFKAACVEIAELANVHIDFDCNRPSEAIHKAIGRKIVTSTVMPQMPMQIAEFRNMSEEDAIDPTWQAIYAIDPVAQVNGSARSMSLVDIKRNTKAYRLASSTAKLRFSDFMASTWDTITGLFYGAGVAVEFALIGADPIITANNIIISIRIALEELKTSEAFTNIQAGISAADGAGYRTAFATDIPTTINAGRHTLAQRNKGQGYGINNTTPYVLIANEAHEETIERYFRDTNNVPFGTVRVNRPISRFYTNNVTASLGLTGNLALLTLPYRRCRMGQFKSISVETWYDPETTSQKWGGRESYEFLTNVDQFEIIELD